MSISNINDISDHMLNYILSCDEDLFKERGKNARVCKKWYQLIKHFSLKIHISSIINIKIAKWAQENGCNLRKLDTNFMVHIMKNADISLIEWACKKNLIHCQFYISSEAAGCGRIDALEILAKYNSKMNEFTFICGIKSGSLDVVNYLYNSGCPIDSRAYYEASKQHCEMLDWLFKHDIPAPDDLYSRIAENGDVRKMKLVSDFGYKLYPDTLRSACYYAACYGHIDIIEWLKLSDVWNEVEFTTDICNYAVMCHQFEMVHYLYENGFPINVETFAKIVETGILDEIKWAHSKKFPMDEQAFIKAAKVGDAKILDLLHSYNCPVNSSAATEAAIWGNLDSLKWLINRGYTLNEDIYDRCAINGYNDILEFLDNLGYKSTILTIKKAAYAGKIETVKWLHAKGLSLNQDIFFNAVRSHNFALVLWLCENNCPMDLRAYEYAEYNDLTDIFNLLKQYKN